MSEEKTETIGGGENVAIELIGVANVTVGPTSITANIPIKVEQTGNVIRIQSRASSQFTFNGMRFSIGEISFGQVNSVFAIGNGAVAYHSGCAPTVEDENAETNGYKRSWACSIDSVESANVTGTGFLIVPFDLVAMGERTLDVNLSGTGKFILGQAAKGDLKNLTVEANLSGTGCICLGDNIIGGIRANVTGTGKICDFKALNFCRACMTGVGKIKGETSAPESRIVKRKIGPGAIEIKRVPRLL
jgi:hypothetical protein